MTPEAQSRVGCEAGAFERAGRRSARLKGRVQELRLFAFGRVAVRVNDEILIAVVRGLDRHTGVDADESAGRHVHPLWRLAHV